MDRTLQRITPRALDALRSWDGDLAVVDVRTSPELAALRAPDTQSLPSEQLGKEVVADRFQSTDIGRERPLYLLCQSGYRAALAAAQLDAEGLNNVIVVDGGLERWAASGLPLIQARQRSGLPVPNQVQVFVGGFLLLVTVLALTVHPAWFLLTTVMGAGLVYGGVTRTCVLEEWLALLPWNRGGTSTQAA